MMGTTFLVERWLKKLSYWVVCTIFFIWIGNNEEIKIEYLVSVEGEDQRIKELLSSRRWDF
jgi:hypothetical protein